MNIEHDYLRLLKDVLDNGKEKEDRTGTGTISVFGRQIRHKMNQGFPLLTTKKMYWKGIVTELLWFLRGDTNIKYIVDNDCHIWDGDAYKNWKSNGRDFWEEQVDGMFTSELGEEEVDKISKEWFINKIKTDDEFAKKWGDLGPIYGKQWRDWTKDKDAGAVEGGVFVEYEQIDQIKNLIEQLKTNPDSRRLMVNAWNVGELDQMTLPPCHYGFQVYTRELSLEERLVLTDEINKEIRQDLYSYAFNNPIYTGGVDQNPDDIERHEFLNDLDIPTRAISLMWNQRSVDTFLGLPFNIASYGLLLEIIAKEVNMIPDELIGNLGDCHLYKNHIEQAKEQLTREPKRLPKVLINNGEVDNNGVPFTKSVLDGYDRTDFELVDYQSHPSIKAPLNN